MRARMAPASSAYKIVYFFDFHSKRILWLRTHKCLVLFSSTSFDSSQVPLAECDCHGSRISHILRQRNRPMPEKMHLTDAEWREKLTPEQYAILRQAATERAFTGKYEKNKAAGEYLCAGCGQPLFESEDKFDSGSGWPSFTKPAESGV